MKNTYDTKVIEITLFGYDPSRISAIMNAIGDGDQKHVEIDWNCYKAGRVEIPHVYAMTEAANGNVEETEIKAIFTNDPLRVARVLGTLVGVADILKSVNILSGRTFRW